MSFFGTSAIILITCISMMAGLPSSLCTTHAIAQAAQIQFTAIALEGDPAPQELGGTYFKIESSSVTTSGEVAFSADLSGSTATSVILLNSSNATRVILRSGDTTPAGGTFKAFHELDIVDGDFVLFRAELQGVQASEGLFLRTPQGVQTVQLAGDKTNGRYPGLIYKSFSQLTMYSFPDLTGALVVNYAFVATLEEKQQEAVVWDDYSQAAGPVTLLVSGSGNFNIRKKEVVDGFVIARLSSLGLTVVADCHKPNVSQHFRRPFWAPDPSGVIEWDQSLTEGLRTPIGKLRQLDVPASVSYHGVLYILAEFGTKRHGSRAILVDDLNTFAAFPFSALLRTGDQAPGIQGETIEDMGLPVAIPGEINPPFPQPNAVVSTVQLSDGRSALWVALLTPAQEVEFTINASLALIGGATGDPAHPILTSFNPVKLTNSGSLLISGSIGDSGDARNGLFLLSGLLG